MNFKTFAAASVIALLPVASLASITVNTEGVDGVQLYSLTGSAATTSDVTGTISGLLIGPGNSADWNMRVINTSPPGPANTEGTATYSFRVLDDTRISMSSTQNPFDSLDNLTLDILVNGVSRASVASYTSGAFAIINPLTVNQNDIIDVVADWSGISGLFNQIDVDFVLAAGSTNVPGAIPLPATALLLVGALGGLGLVARKKRS